MRSYPPFAGEQSAGYLAVNRSKRSLALNLRSDDGKRIFFELAKTADIVVESFRPGRLKKMGLDYEKARTVSEKII
jgi:crotonobetainyl-CoA:carnitine CoA-transferase CaiB-like acyl-CoA transferase